MRKKTIKLFLGALASVALLSIASFATVFAATDSTTMTTTDALNFRSTPSMGNNIICEIPAGTSVPVFDMDESGWYTINYENKEGYVYYKYLDFESNQKRSGGKQTTMYAVCELNVRDKAANSGAILTVLNENQGIEVIGKKDGWFQVRANGVTGYSYGSYLRFGLDGKYADEDAAHNVANTLTATGSLNVRTAPSMSGEVIGYYQKGDSVDAIALEGQWYKVNFKGTTAYAYGKWIQ
ncbi:MAG: SH3 domain-containing protein [Hespellia sp.]|nr:SH3 domain-containing protein [Hespellia sp.]